MAVFTSSHWSCDGHYAGTCLGLDIVLAYYEEEFPRSLQQQPLVWRRYIDDILTIWPYGGAFVHLRKLLDLTNI